jgi:hypothetical protein
MSIGRSLLIAALLVVVVAPLAWADPPTTTVRMFRLRHVSVLEASQAVQPLLSESGSLTLQPHQSRITVQDRPEVVEQVAEAIRKLDHRPDLYHLRVELLAGSTEAAISKPEATVDPRLRRMFRFTSYHRIGSADFEGELGDAAVARLGSRYRISFVPASLGITEDTPWGIPNPGTRIVLQSLVLERLVEGESEAGSVEVLRTRVFLSPNQEAIIGAGGSEESTSGLVLILKAMDAGER